MSGGPFLITERLILRPPSAEDFEGWAAFCADPVTMTHLGGAKGRGESWRMLCTMVGAWHMHRWTGEPRWMALVRQAADVLEANGRSYEERLASLGMPGLLRSWKAALVRSHVPDGPPGARTSPSRISTTTPTATRSSTRTATRRAILERDMG